MTRQRLKPNSFRDHVGQQGHVTSTQDSVSDGSLVLGTVAGLAAGNQVAVAIEHHLKGPQILVIHEHRTRATLGCTEPALQLPLDASTFPLVGTLGLLVELEWTNHAATTLCVLLFEINHCLLVSSGDEKWISGPFQPRKQAIMAFRVKSCNRTQVEGQRVKIAIPAFPEPTFSIRELSKVVQGHPHRSGSLEQSLPTEPAPFAKRDSR